jgi:hypothetical protein
MGGAWEAADGEYHLWSEPGPGRPGAGNPVRGGGTAAWTWHLCQGPRRWETSLRRLRRWVAAITLPPARRPASVVAPPDGRHRVAPAGRNCGRTSRPSWRLVIVGLAWPRRVAAISSHPAGQHSGRTGRPISRSVIVGFPWEAPSTERLTESVGARQDAPGGGHGRQATPTEGDTAGRGWGASGGGWGTRLCRWGPWCGWRCMYQFLRRKHV